MSTRRDDLERELSAERAYLSRAQDELDEATSRVACSQERIELLQEQIDALPSEDEE